MAHRAHPAWLWATLLQDWVFISAVLSAGAERSEHSFPSPQQKGTGPTALTWILTGCAQHCALWEQQRQVPKFYLSSPKDKEVVLLPEGSRAWEMESTTAVYDYT